MDGYCHECSVTRCDTTDSTCTRDASRAVSPAAAPDVTALAQTIQEGVGALASDALNLAWTYAEEDRWRAEDAVKAVKQETDDALAALLAEVERLRQERDEAQRTPFNQDTD